MLVEVEVNLMYLLCKSVIEGIFLVINKCGNVIFEKSL